MLRYLTAGESHGKTLIALVDGFPAGVTVDVEPINVELKRRQGGYGRGGAPVSRCGLATIPCGILTQEAWHECEFKEVVPVCGWQSGFSKK